MKRHSWVSAIEVLFACLCAISCQQQLFAACCLFSCHPHSPAHRGCRGWHWFCGNGCWLLAVFWCCYTNSPTRPFHLCQVKSWGWDGAGLGNEEAAPTFELDTANMTPGQSQSALLPDTGVMSGTWLWKRNVPLA